MPHHHKLYIFILLSIFISSCHGQNNPPEKAANEVIANATTPTKHEAASLGEIRIDSTKRTKLDFSVIEGHFDAIYGNVNRGFEDKAGNLWFGTTGAGAIRYDGQFFTQFTIKDRQGNNSLTPLLQDAAGNIWFAAADGVFRYNGKDFTPIPIPHTNAKSASAFATNGATGRGNMPLSITSAMQDRKGNIWIATELNGVYRYDGKTFVPLLSTAGIVNSGGHRLNSITQMLEDRKGAIWFASWNNEGLCRLSGDSLVSFTPKNGLGDNMVHAVAEDKAGDIWIGTRNHGLWRYDGTTFTNISVQTDLKDESIYSIVQDKTGAIWMSTQSKGVWRYDGKSFTNFTTKDGLSNNSAFCVVAQRNGHLWFGTRGMGLCSYDGKKFTDFTTHK
jgi:ligand-binding sensor domain-containing protein